MGPSPSYRAIVRSARWEAMRCGLVVATLALAGCGESGDAVDEAPTCVPSDPAQIPHETLSEYCLFVGPLVDEVPAPGVVPYTVNTPLWADLAEKGRYIALPEGGTIEVGDDREEWVFPVGTLLIKSFYFTLDRRDPDGAFRTIETRLLINEPDGWSNHTYVFDDAQTEATRFVAGKRVPVSYTDADGNEAEQDYLVPNTNQCGNCHERDDEIGVLGPFTPQMNVEGQLARMEALGMFSEPLGDIGAMDKMAAIDGPEPLETRARDYLHGQCAHCHRDGGGGGRSGLSLLRWEDDPSSYGICKRPVAAGDGSGDLAADIVPGDPERSILVFRMKSVDPEIKMPELPNRLPDDAGIDLVSEWIRSLAPAGCD